MRKYEEIFEIHQTKHQRRIPGHTEGVLIYGREGYPSNRLAARRRYDSPPSRFYRHSPRQNKHFFFRIGRVVCQVVLHYQHNVIVVIPGRLSLSGAQEKYSAVIDRGVFRLTKEGERGTYILKPKLTGFENREFSPANENLTMQIASQVYGIQTAENAVCFTSGGEQVYVTKRYDVRGMAAASSRRIWLH